MGDILDQLKYLITNQPHHRQLAPQQSIPNTSTLSLFIPNSLLTYWNTKSYTQKKLLLFQATLILSTAFYILLPSLPFYKKKEMFSKRPDKYTTGFINLRNDCFANSSLQAYSSLPSLTEYLNKFITCFKKLLEFIETHDIDVQKLIDLRLESNKFLQNSKFKRSNSTYDIPLHFAMAAMVKKLQEIELASRTISVWTFLHELEKIFNAKMSRSQHDAHELTQLINETLENENLKLKSFVKFLMLNLHKMLKDHPSPKDYNDLENIVVPEFPFDGLILSQMTCLSCNGVSKPNFSPFVILTLPVPLAPSTKLEKMLDENESEQIEGYQCIKCRVGKIVLNEERMKRDIPSDQESFIKQIFDLYNSPNLCINEDIPEDLEIFIKNYNVDGIDISRVTSTVQKKSQILKPPKIFGLHLSRSSFDGQVVTRNSCQVEFNDKMTLSIGSEYHDKLKQFQAMVHEEDEKQMEKLTNKVLTTDVNDMEDGDVQREDIEERGQEDDEEDDEEDLGDVTDEGTTTENATDELEDDEEDEDDEDSSSLTSQESVPQTITTSSTIRPSSDSTNGSHEHSINLAPISNKQTDNLKEIFKRFKFNDNDLYKYRLRAVIKHVGSHTQGHYECFKHKPLFVKDKDGNIFKLSPEIHDDITGETHANAELIDDNSSSSSSKGTRRRSSVRSNGSNDLDSRFRGRFSSMMGRRPSVFQANPSGVEEIISSGLQTPAEILVDDPSLNNFENAFAAHNFKDSFAKTSTVNEEDNAKPEKKVKMKKIPSTITKPYWRISDAQVTEVTKGAVLSEETTVYMLYYERVDRKQIKRHHRS